MPQAISSASAIRLAPGEVQGRGWEEKTGFTEGSEVGIFYTTFCRYVPATSGPRGSRAEPREAALEMLASRMRVTIHYFATLRDRRGLDTEELEIEQGLTLRQLYQQLFPPDHLPAPPPVLFVQDEAYVSGDTAVRDGAEVAFIPPLGGG